MQKAIGPSFGDELEAAGLLGQPFSWDASGNLYFPSGASQTLIAGVEAVYATHDPRMLSLAEKTAQQGALMAMANAATSGMSDAYVAGLLDAADAATFKAWSAYKLALSKVDLTVASPAWPAVPLNLV